MSYIMGIDAMVLMMTLQNNSGNGTANTANNCYATRNQVWKLLSIMAVALHSYLFQFKT